VAQSAGERSGFPFSTTYVASSAAFAVADVAYRVDRIRRHGEYVALVERRRRHAVDLVLQGAFDDVDDLLAGMGVPDEGRFGRDVDPALDDLASGGH
jgi:hypothetical protein